MKTLIISSSLSPSSHSYLLCRAAEKELKALGVEVTFVDARELDIQPHHKEVTQDMLHLREQVAAADNLIFGMGVHCYSVNDHLKMILDNCMEKGGVGKFFGVLCAAGGTRSYLATMHLTQICMNEWRMIQLPRVVVASKEDFGDGKIIGEDILDRLPRFATEFKEIGDKLIA